MLLFPLKEKKNKEAGMSGKKRDKKIIQDWKSSNQVQKETGERKKRYTYVWKKRMTF